MKPASLRAVKTQRDRTAIVNQIQLRLIITKEPVSVNARASNGRRRASHERRVWGGHSASSPSTKGKYSQILCNVTCFSWLGQQGRDNKSGFKSRTCNCLLCMLIPNQSSCFRVPPVLGETRSVGPCRVAPQHSASAPPRVRIAPGPVVAPAHLSGPHLRGHVPGEGRDRVTWPGVYDRALGLSHASVLPSRTKTNILPVCQSNPHTKRSHTRGGREQVMVMV